MTEKPVWFDTHVHLSDPKFDSDRDQVLEKIFSSGLAGFVEIADGPSEWPKAQALAERFPGKIWWAAGLHPYFSDQGSIVLWKQLEELSQHPQFVALGEVGLDYAKCPIPREKQMESFESALDLAEKINKPLVVHCRDAYADLLPMLKQRFSPNPTVSPGVIHCFSGNQNEADELIHLGFYLGVDGPLTYPKAQDLRDIFSKIPLEKVVLETDSPYLPPQPFRGQRNEPTHVSHIGNKLAEIRQMAPALLSQQLLENSLQLFRLNPTEK